MSDRRRKFHDQLYCHFVTFSCHRRRKILDDDQPKRILIGQVNSELRRLSAKCVGFVVMPDHVHLLVWFPQTGQLSRFMQNWKRLSSHSIRKWYGEHHSDYFRSADQPGRQWTLKYYSFEIFTEQNIREKLDYMHMNPVRAGLVERAVDWKWGSARWYEQRKPVGVPVN